MGNISVESTIKGEDNGLGSNISLYLVSQNVKTTFIHSLHS